MGFTEQEKEQLRQIIREEISAAQASTVKPAELPSLNVEMDKSGRLSVSTYQKCGNREL